jgi:hypothetical protein
MEFPSEMDYCVPWNQTPTSDEPLGDLMRVERDF